MKKGTSLLKKAIYGLVGASALFMVVFPSSALANSYMPFPFTPSYVQSAFPSWEGHLVEVNLQVLHTGCVSCDSMMSFHVIDSNHGVYYWECGLPCGEGCSPGYCKNFYEDHYYGCATPYDPETYDYDGDDIVDADDPYPQDGDCPGSADYYLEASYRDSVTGCHLDFYVDQNGVCPSLWVSNCDSGALDSFDYEGFGRDTRWKEDLVIGGGHKSWDSISATEDKYSGEGQWWTVPEGEGSGWEDIGPQIGTIPQQDSPGGFDPDTDNTSGDSDDVVDTDLKELAKLLEAVRQNTSETASGVGALSQLTDYIYDAETGQLYILEDINRKLTMMTEDGVDVNMPEGWGNPLSQGEAAAAVSQGIGDSGLLDGGNDPGDEGQPGDIDQEAYGEQYGEGDEDIEDETLSEHEEDKSFLEEFLDEWLEDSPFYQVFEDTGIDIEGATCYVSCEVFGTEIEFSFCDDPIATFLEVLGNFILGIATLYAIFIIFGKS